VINGEWAPGHERSEGREGGTPYAENRPFHITAKQVNSDTSVRNKELIAHIYYCLKERLESPPVLPYEAGIDALPKGEF